MNGQLLILMAALLAATARVSLPAGRLAMMPLLAMLLTACAAPRVEYVTTPLPIPVRPELPRIPGDELQCLSDRAYDAIVRRDRQRRDYAEQLESVIQSTHDTEARE